MNDALDLMIARAELGPLPNHGDHRRYLLAPAPLVRKLVAMRRASSSVTRLDLWLEAAVSIVDAVDDRGGVDSIEAALERLHAVTVAWLELIAKEREA